MVIDGDPNGHCVVLKLAVHLVHIQTVIKVLLESKNVLFVFCLLPLSHLGLQPSFLFEDLEAELAAEELSNEDVTMFSAFSPENVKDFVIDHEQLVQRVRLAILVKANFLKHIKCRG